MSSSHEMHDVCPSAAWYLPAGQSSQLSAAVSALAFPASQSVHAWSCPGPGEKRPAAHLGQMVAALVSDQRPAAQTMQAVAPAADAGTYWPAMQSVQAVLVSAVAEYLTEREG